MRRKLGNHIFLLRLQHQRDPELFARFYDDHAENIYRFVLLKVSSPEVAEDITSETFLKTWQYINDATEEIRDLKAFLYRVARNLVIDYYRQKAKSDLPTDDNILDQLPDEQKDSYMQLERSGDLDHILFCISKLKNEYQEVLLLRYIDELSIAEIAAVLGKKKGAVRVLLHRAMKTLKNIVEDS